jgi:hypothetical protein
LEISATNPTRHSTTSYSSRIACAGMNFGVRFYQPSMSFVMVGGSLQVGIA